MSNGEKNDLIMPQIMSAGRAAGLYQEARILKILLALIDFALFLLFSVHRNFDP